MSEEWEVTFGDVKEDSNCKFGTSVKGTCRGNLNGSSSQSVDWNLVNVGTALNVSSVKAEKGYGDGTGTLSVQGPSTGYDIGVKCNSDRVGLDGMLELSAAKAKATAGPFFVEGNLNVNTGAKIGTDGVKVGFLGLGCTLGVGGKWSFDTPFGSFGGEETQTHTLKNTKSNLLYAE